MAKTDGTIAADSKTTAGIALQPASEDIWTQKYRLTSKDGTPIDASVDATWQRVARALADVEPAHFLGHGPAEINIFRFGAPRFFFG